MRLSNKHKVPLYSFVNTLLLMFVVVGVVVYLLERYKYQYLGWEGYLLIIVPIILLLVFYVRGRQIFEYDSDGETLNFKNRNIIPFIDKNLSDEFPKYKLLKYELVTVLFFRRLYVNITSKKKERIILKYDVSYLTKKETSDLKHSLSKIVKANKEQSQNSENK